MGLRSSLCALLLAGGACAAMAVPCADEDFATHVTAGDECLLIARYGSAAPTTTAPGLAAAYIAKLKARGIDADFEQVPQAGHLDILASPVLVEAALALIQE
jgi:hypothetical protein